MVLRNNPIEEQERALEMISFAVLGEPSPEGSTKAFYIPKLNRTVTTHQNQKSLNEWRQRVATEAQRALDSQPWTNDGVSAYRVDVEFVLTRPSSVPTHRRKHPIIKPDIDKLVRAINDALTHILFNDDCQVVAISCTKDYDDDRRSGAYISVYRYINVTEKARKGKRSPPAREEASSDDPRDD